MAFTEQGMSNTGVVPAIVARTIAAQDRLVHDFTCLASAGYCQAVGTDVQP